MPFLNMALAGLFVASYLTLFVPTENLVKKKLGLQVSRILVSALLVIVAAGLLLFITGVEGVVYVALLAFCVWAFTFGFSVNRKYIYILALVFLIFCPLLLIVRLTRIAEFSAILCFLFLVLGVLRDILYDKIVDGVANDQ